MPEANYDRRKGDGEMRILIEEIKGDIKLLMGKIETLVKSVDNLNNTTVTREELKLTLDTFDNRINVNSKRLSDLEEINKNFRNGLTSVIVIIGLALFSYLLAHVITGFSL